MYHVYRLNADHMFKRVGSFEEELHAQEHAGFARGFVTEQDHGPLWAGPDVPPPASPWELIVETLQEGGHIVEGVDPHVWLVVDSE